MEVFTRFFSKAWIFIIGKTIERGEGEVWAKTIERAKIFCGKVFHQKTENSSNIERGRAEKLSRIIKFNSHFNSTLAVKLNRQIPTSE